MDFLGRHAVAEHETWRLPQGEEDSTKDIEANEQFPYGFRDAWTGWGILKEKGEKQWSATQLAMKTYIRQQGKARPRKTGKAAAGARFHLPFFISP